MSNTNDFIYMAGLMDGEGTIGIAHSNNKIYRNPYISLSSTTPEFMEWLKETFGGCICVQKTYQEHHKPAWSWRIGNLSQMRCLLEGILPYMKEPDKIRRGNLILNEYPLVTKRNGKYSEAERHNKLDFEARFLNN